MILAGGLAHVVDADPLEQVRRSEPAEIAVDQSQVANGTADELFVPWSPPVSLSWEGETKLNDLEV